ncbi:hypothetical protein BV20DRAFT_958127 [Pilatotrama ljubarskyi]|nr:hypothetical protein BV20DRAFT_958127 [Pilatotrama ljubarskyi]
MRWFYSGSVVKSAGELDRLVNDVILAPDFKPADLRGFRAKTEMKRMDDHTNGSGAFPAEDGWRKGTVKIPLPKTKVKHDSEADVPTFTVDNIFFRPLLASLKAAYEDTIAGRYNFIPFRMYAEPRPLRSSPPALHSSPSARSPERLYSESYNSDAFIQLDEDIQEKARSDREPGDAPDLEYAVAPIALYSDSTHLTNFGTASLWPIYFWISSLSKYVRARPTSFSAHHLAYIPALSSLIHQAYKHEYDDTPTAAILRFCKKELIQQIWLLLLDDDFVQAYVHGFIVKCGDGITRRLFPCILTYSADYPEKCLIACIKFLGRCPCPDCLVNKSQIHLMGTKNDMAARVRKVRKDSHPLRYTLARVRAWIFGGSAPEGKHVEDILGDTSTSPNQSAFSRRLAQFGFDIYRTLVPC